MTLLSILLLFSVPSQAATVVVDPSGGGDALTIADGMALLTEGDTLYIRAGTYYEEDLENPVDDVTIQGEGADVTHVIGESDYYVFHLYGTVTLSDLDVQSYAGDAISYTNNSDSDTRVAVFERNRLQSFDSACIALWSDVGEHDIVYVLENLFDECPYGVNDPYGGDSMHVENNVFIGNNAGVVVESEYSSSEEVTHHVYHNTFIGVSWTTIIREVGTGWGKSNYRIANNIFHDVKAAYGVYDDAGNDDEFVANLVGDSDYLYTGDEITDSHDNLEGEDPLFVDYDPDADWEDLDLSLQEGSPAIDLGSSAYTTVMAEGYGGTSRPLDGDGDGTAEPDAGAYEYDPGTTDDPDTGDLDTGAFDTGDLDTGVPDTGTSDTGSDTASGDDTGTASDSGTPDDSASPGDTGIDKDDTGCATGSGRASSPQALLLALFALTARSLRRSRRARSMRHADR